MEWAGETWRVVRVGEGERRLVEMVTRRGEGEEAGTL